LSGGTSEPDGPGGPHDGATPGLGSGVQDVTAVYGAGPPVCHLGAGTLQSRGTLFDVKHGAAQNGYGLLRSPTRQRVTVWRPGVRYPAPYLIGQGEILNHQSTFAPLRIYHEQMNLLRMPSRAMLAVLLPGVLSSLV